ncbi:hypothetical protein AMJ85_08500 [candidate division BRC1 bacterium SM23_51]|nr:MAG: hypothetical protein AMJ85_08500 [candidate division BRC1 bacterium SM23_51]
MDAKRIIIFVVLLVILVFVGRRAVKAWRKYNPRPTFQTAPAPAQPAPAAPAPASPNNAS